MHEGIFPSVWKKAKVILISKGEIQAVGPPKVRPICLLDEIGKIFKRVIVARIKA